MFKYWWGEAPRPPRIDDLAYKVPWVLYVIWYKTELNIVSRYSPYPHRFCTKQHVKPLTAHCFALQPFLCPFSRHSPRCRTCIRHRTGHADVVRSSISSHSPAAAWSTSTRWAAETWQRAARQRQARTEPGTSQRLDNHEDQPCCTANLRHTSIISTIVNRTIFTIDKF